MLPPALKLRNVQIAEFLSEETLAFSAELELYGKNVGVARNDGHGGSHAYHFNTARDRGAFQRMVDAWASREEISLEPADQLIDELIERWEIAQRAREVALASNTTRVLCVRKSPQYLASQDQHPIGWDETYLLPLDADQDPAVVAASERADAHHLITFGK